MAHDISAALAAQPKLAISEIIVHRSERQRRQITTEDLEASIARVGLLQPVVVESTPEGPVLRAGERRLSACKALGWAEIPIVWLAQLSPVEAQLVELEENVKRKDLPWQDLARAVARVHEMYKVLDPGWTMEETAQALGLASKGWISECIKVADALTDEDPRVAEADSLKAAYNVLTRREQRAAGDALQALLDEPMPTAAAAPVPPSTLTGTDLAPGAAGGATVGATLLRPAARLTPALLEPPPVEKAILAESFLHWAPKYTGAKFSLVHCDFPYGIDLFSGPQGRGAEPGQGYTDTPEVYWALLECLCTNLDRVMSVSGHLMFWLSADTATVARTLDVFAKRAPSLGFHKFPLVWLKSDNAGIASDPRRGPRHVYETCLLASRGRRQILRVAADAYSAPTDKRLHPSCKPEPMLRHFMQMLVDETTSLFDPTCGSAAALRAAESLGARRVLGLEIDPDAAGVARTALRNARSMRTLAGGKP